MVAILRGALGPSEADDTVDHASRPRGAETSPGLSHPREVDMAEDAKFVMHGDPDRGYTWSLEVLEEVIAESPTTRKTWDEAKMVMERVRAAAASAGFLDLSEIGR